MAQDFYDILQVFDHVIDTLEENKAQLGLKYIAKLDEALIPEFPAVLVQTDRTDRVLHATGQFYIEHHLDFWVFHAQMDTSAATRSRKDIELATNVRKLLHANRTLDGHVIHSFVNGERPGQSLRFISNERVAIMTTLLTWSAELRAPFEVS